LGAETHFVATDGFRLAFRREELALDEMSVLFPARAFTEIVKLATQEKVDEVVFAISTELQQVSCQVGQAQLYVRLLEGDFPPYQKILPHQFTGEVLLDREELGQILKTASIFTRDSSKIVTLSLRQDELLVSATSPALGTHEGRMPLKRLAGEPMDIAFNVQYIIDLIAKTSSDNLLLKTNGSLDPAVFALEADPAFLYVIMPFKLGSAN
jgi:DNA polymerase-3 subunit beta